MRGDNVHFEADVVFEGRRAMVASRRTFQSVHLHNMRRAFLLSSKCGVQEMQG